MEPRLGVRQVLEPGKRLHLHLLTLSLALLTLFGGAAHAATTPPRVTAITDSVGGILLWDHEAHTILGSGLDLDVEPLICRKLATPGCGGAAPPSALDTASSLGPRLGRIVIVDVGYNDTTPELAAGIDPLMRVLVGNGVEHVIWVNYVEHLEVWAASNRVLAAAAARWPQLVLADWNSVALTQPGWFVDEAHLDPVGGRNLASFLRPLVLAACATACRQLHSYCGLVRTRSGFDYVRQDGLGCAAARATIASVERGIRGDWACARRVDGTVELRCTSYGRTIDVLERSPAPAVRRNGVVVLSNWSFRLRGAVLQGREDTLGWISLGRAPWCVPDVPREALLALRLKPRTPNGGCFTARG
jgi:hypothetical protein